MGDRRRPDGCSSTWAAPRRGPRSCRASCGRSGSWRPSRGCSCRWTGSSTTTSPRWTSAGSPGASSTPTRAVGIWDRIVAEAGAWSGTVLISHELFASATKEQAARAIASFGDDTEVHVVVTARDLVRQIPAEWQEHVKHRSTKTLPEFVDDLRRRHRRGRAGSGRCRTSRTCVDRWGSTLPPAQVHVVTVPPAGADPGTLWDRFATLLGLDPGSFDTQASRANTSLGVEQAELLRRVNGALGDRVPLPGPVPAGRQEPARPQDPRRPSGHPADPGPADHGVRAPAVPGDRRAAHLHGGRRGRATSRSWCPSRSPHGRWPRNRSSPRPTRSSCRRASPPWRGCSTRWRTGGRSGATRSWSGTSSAPPLRFALIQASERRPLLRKARNVYRRRTLITERLSKPLRRRQMSAPSSSSGRPRPRGRGPTRPRS